MKNAFLKEHETKLALSEFILKADRLSMDVECLKFERKFSEYQGRQDSILFNSGGSANLAMLQALKNLGKDHIDQKARLQIAKFLENSPKEEIKKTEKLVNEQIEKGLDVKIN